MLKNFKKIFSFLLMLVVIVGISNTWIVNAQSYENQSLTHESFTKMQEEGDIGYDVTYEYMLQLSEESNKLEKELEDSKDFYKVFDSSLLRSSANLNIKSGDVIITNSTSSFGLTGHAAIALGSNEILDIPAPKKSVRTQTVKQFRDAYSSGWIKVYRPSNSTWGSKAAGWARKTYKGSNAKYKITLDINTTTETYCSKIVFQAYKFGVGSSAFNTYYHSQGDFTGSDYDVKWGIIISPYALPTSLKINYIDRLR